MLFSQRRETASHVIGFCSRFEETRRIIADPQTGRIDIKTLTSTPKGVRRLAKWFIKLGLLPQFALAEQLLYGNDSDAPDESENARLISE